MHENRRVWITTVLPSVSVLDEEDLCAWGLDAGFYKE